MTTIVSGSSITFNDNTTQNTSAYGGGFAFRNRIINGDMRIDQRNAGASVTPTVDNQYTLDRWRCSLTQSSKFSVQQNAGSVTPPTGFTNYLGVTSTSAYSVGASDVFGIVQLIEGFNTSDLAFGTANARTVTLSFWVRSSLTGTFAGVLNNGIFNRSYPFTYTISAANTWEQKTVTIAGDTTGTWNTTTSASMGAFFSLGAGSTFSGTAGAWVTGNILSATGATSVVGTNGATFYITGVQLEKGSTATSFDYRPYGQELALCQRYYEKSYTTTVAPNTNTGEGAVIFRGTSQSGNATGNSIFFKVEKRTSPTMAFINLNGTANSWNYDRSGASGTATPAVTFTPSTSCSTVEVNIGAAWVAAQIYGHYTASAEL